MSNVIAVGRPQARPARRRKKGLQDAICDPICQLQVAVIFLLLYLAPSLGVAASQPHFQLVGQAGGQARLPCLVGQPSVCGQPYFIAWYKLNPREDTWTRFEYQRDSPEPDSSGALSERAEFRWPDVQSSLCQELAPAASHQFNCAQLSIRKLELLDEGQYKCAITFSESIEVDKCPPYTISQLSVTAKASEPQLLVNGQRPADQPLVFKEGAQVRLECQSSGGKPAPHIEWLNLTEWDEQGTGQVQLMRSRWPTKRLDWSPGEPAPPSLRNLSPPLASSSVIFSLSRYDLRSQFICALLANQSRDEQLPLLKKVAYLSTLLRQPSKSAGAPMLKRIKLDVQVKPSRVSIVVRDLQSNTSLEPQTGLLPNSYYSLQPDRLYAIQCLVENSRPAAQVAWFNRTVPVGVRQVQLDGEADFELASADGAPHRLTSFSRQSAGSTNGTFSTTASLLLTTSVWDNYEELFCRISNEAFSFDELIQVAPIASARLYVNYPPLAWMEPVEPPAPVGQPPATDLLRLRATQGGPLVLRCTLAANPLTQSAILQIDWLKDNQRLSNNNNTKQQAARIHIEKANHLHMPVAGQLAPASKLVGSSSLTIGALAKSHAGLYSCQFKLIPAPTNSAQSTSPAQPTRIMAGQANQSIQVQVIEAKLKSPTLRILASTRWLLVYGRTKRPLTVLLTAGPRQELSLKCDLAGGDAWKWEEQGRHKVVWYLNGLYLHSSASSDVYNFTPSSWLLPATAGGGQPGELASEQLGTVSCAHQLLAPEQASDSFHGAAIRVYRSANQLELKYKARPRLLARRPELMPPVRSFSEPELMAAPNGRLKLICLAQCEPLCSIQWLLNGRPLSDDPTGRQLEPNGSWLVSAWPLEPAQLGRLSALEGRGSAPNGSRFSWIKASSLAPGPAAVDLELASSRLMHQAERLLATSQANVFSKLELAYSQIWQLLSKGEEASQDQVEIKCRLSTQLDGQLARALIEPGRWFPATAADSAEESSLAVGELSNRPLDLAAAELGDDLNASTGELPTSSLSSPLPSNWQDPLTVSSHGNEEQQLDNADEMQINILLDKPPKGAGVFLQSGGRHDDDDDDSRRPLEGLTLGEAELLDLTDPSKPAALLQCKPLGNPYPPVQFKWSFTDLNKTEHLISTPDNESHQLNLRQFIQLRQRQLHLDPTSAYGAELVANLVGNYTCHVSNIHGSSSSSIQLRLQGRPLCKLSLAGEYLSPDNELLAYLRCSIYSLPALQETFWFKSDKQIAVNKTSETVDDQPAFSNVDLPVMVLNKQQDFMLNDLVLAESSQGSGNFKCFARNAMGFSKACELSLIDRQTLMNTLKPTGSKSPALPMLSLFSDPKIPVNHLITGNGSSIELTTSISQPVSSLMRNLIARLDLILMVLGSLGLVCLMFIASTSILRRRRGDHRKLRANQYDTSWRFNTAVRLSGSNTNEISPGTFQASKKVCINYYGGSNGDSEHDMIQSSHSSHYDDYQQQQPQQQLMQQPISLSQQHPIYFNHSTLNRRPLKSSMSSSSTGESIGCKNNRLGKSQFNTMRTDLTKAINLDSALGEPTNLAATLANNRPLSGLLNGQSPSSNVPLVDGTHHSSRINLDGSHRNGYHVNRHYSRDQQTFTNGLQPLRNEHIYDDVIYQQMIL